MRLLTQLAYQTIGEAFELSGANIKAAVLRAAFVAATSGRQFTTRSLADTADREFENAGKLPRRFRWSGQCPSPAPCSAGDAPSPARAIAARPVALAARVRL